MKIQQGKIADGVSNSLLVRHSVISCGFQSSSAVALVRCRLPNSCNHYFVERAGEMFSNLCEYLRTTPFLLSPALSSSLLNNEDIKPKSI
jgi:hypothetical protein